MSSWAWIARSFATVGLAVLIGPGCGGSGGGGGGPTTPPPPPPPPPPSSGVSFTADGPAGTNSVFLAAGSSTSTRFVLEIRVSEVTDLYGVSLDIEFPRDFLEYQADGTRKGDFLRQGGTRTELLVENKPRGNLVIGYSRFGEASGVDGSGLLLELEFTARATGGAPLVIEENDAVNSTGAVQGDVSWVSGSVNVVLP